MIELQLNACKAEHIESLSELLEELGALSITLMDEHDNPILEPAPGETPLWNDIILKALFDHVDEVIPAIKQHDPSIEIILHDVPEQDWERVCMQDFNPQRFGERLWICPTWHTPPEPNHVNLILDPGLAFGTGTHPTTSLCLKWLEQANLANQTILDYGWGSGILGFAALKLGATHAYTVDIDDQALIATRSNAEVNHISPEQLTVGFPDTLTCQTDYVIANILLTPLLTLKSRFASLLKPTGLLVVSGLLATQTEALIEAYVGQFEHHQTLVEGDWALVIFKPSDQT